MIVRSGVLLCALFLSSLSQAAQALEYHAILVGVTDYPELKKSLSLTGPENDISLVKSVLQEKGFANDRIDVLSESSGRAPTRAAILDAFKALGTEIEGMKRAGQREHFVYLHFSGHGSQQPARSDSDELDGMDEIFLPKDVRDWNYSVGEVENAITDNEIGELITGLRETGAFVWVVFDSCHSGTMTRAVDDSIVMRKVDPCALGIPGCGSLDTEPDAGFTVTEAPTMRGAPAGATKPAANMAEGLGGLVAFYAAQSSESTPEMAIPRGEKTHGFFTYMTMQGLLENSRITYRQLAELVVQKYNAHPWHRSRPLFEGTDLDRFVLDDERQLTPQWPVSQAGAELAVEAGELHGVTVGTIMGLFPKANAEPDEVLAYFAVETASASQATLSPIEHEGKPALASADVAAGAYVQIASRRASFRLRVALHPDSDKYAELDNALAQKSASESGLIEQAPEVEGSELVIALKSGRMWFLDPGQNLPCELMSEGELDRYFGGAPAEALPKCKTSQEGLQATYLDVSDNQDVSAVLDQGVAKIARVTGLLRLAGELGSLDGQIESELNVSRARDGDASTITPDTVPVLRNGDKVAFSVHNNGYTNADVSLFFIGSDYGITQVFPGAGRSARMEMQGKLERSLGKINAKTTGREYMVVVANDVSPDAAITDNSFLQQSGLQTEEANAVTKRGNSNPSAIQQLWEASRQTGGISTMTRGFDSSDEKSGSIKVFSWETASQ